MLLFKTHFSGMFQLVILRKLFGRTRKSSVLDARKGVTGRGITAGTTFLPATTSDRTHRTSEERSNEKFDALTHMTFIPLSLSFFTHENYALRYIIIIPFLIATIYY